MGNESCLDCVADCGECVNPVAPEKINLVGGGGCNVGGGNMSMIGVLFVILALLFTRFRKLIVVGVLLFTTPVFATPVNSLKLATTSHDYWTTVRPETLPHYVLNTRVSLRYDNLPLQLVRIPGNGYVGSVVDRRIHADIAAALGLFDRLEVGIVVPTTLYTNVGDRFGVMGLDESNVKIADLGDIRLVPKANILTAGWFGIGVALPFTLPTGDVRRLNGENGWAATPTIVLGVNTHRVGIGANVGYLARAKHNIVVGSQTVRLDDALTFGVGGRLTVLDNSGWLKSLDVIGDVWGYTSVYGTRQEDVPLEVLGGLRVHTTPGFLADLGAGAGLTRGFAAPEWRVVASVGWEFDAPKPCPACSEKFQVIEKKVVEKVEVIKVVNRVVIFPMVYFDTDSATLRPDALDALEDVVRILRENQSITRVALDGHCDKRAGRQYNYRLSESRINSVINHLTANGIVLERLVSRPRGETLANQTAASADSLQADRRVEFKVLEVD